MDKGAVFHDPFAVRILGTDGGDLAREPDSPYAARYRLFIAARSRIAETGLQEALGSGIRQAVVLGAGLDTTGLRYADSQDGLAVFEVDQPAMQAWKTDNLRSLGIDIPPSMHLVPIDFESESLLDNLQAHGFNSARPAFFIWLGVVYYLSKTAIRATLQFVASMPGSEIVFDYSEPAESLPPESRVLFEERSRLVAAAGEPWLSHFTPSEIALLLGETGFARIVDLDRLDIFARYSPGIGPQPGASRAGAHVIHAYMKGP